VPRVSARQDAVAAAFAAAIEKGLIPPPADPGRPVAGVVLAPAEGGSVTVLGGPRPLRVSAASAPRVRALLSGDAQPDPGELLVLHRAGLWGAPAGSSPESVFLSRRAASTRRHSGGDGARAALDASRVRVVGASALAESVRSLLGTRSSRAVAAGSDGVDLDLRMDTPWDPDPSVVSSSSADRDAVLVRTTATGVRVGPWVTAGERPCARCVDAAESRRGAEVPPLSRSRLAIAAAIVVLEVTNSIAGIGRTVRPGIRVDHDLVAGASEVHVIVPLPGCLRCAGPAVSEASRRRPDADALHDLRLALRDAAPTRRWRPPGEHELHLTAAALLPQRLPDAGGTPTCPAFLARSTPAVGVILRGLTHARERDGVITRAEPSAGNLGAAGLVDRAGGVAVAVDVDRLRPKYAEGALPLGIADAGALLGALVARGHLAGAVTTVLDDTLLIERSRVIGPVVTLAHPSPRHDGGTGGAAPGIRPHSTREPRWIPADAPLVRRAVRTARLLLPAAPHLRADLLAPDGRVIPSGRARPAHRVIVRDCLAQVDVGAEAALLVVTVDVRAVLALDRCRHDAAALLGATATWASAAGLRGCLVHGLVPGAVADALGGGYLSTFPLFGWLCGRADAVPGEERADGR
jgi:hypothetical protein